ncbi:hypothetical protein M378DRAFT_166963 [Amanita muscaria Koide BX008]|uniref:DUF6533 domain-containing protein n=1 Tax=Amanita muscaria (strain Koide BX008) TaxID=946122 RepID=A0A0C2WYL3_AMAMK|nr:hypothetical protein M378DRAFT_166963 [Amanita muscaria Koide BX008]
MSLGDIQGAAERGLTVRSAALSVLLYDYSLTLADEIELFWLQEKPWTLATCLFLWSRYCGLIVIISGFTVALSGSSSNDVRQKWLLFESFLGTLNTWAVQLILQLRLYALHGSSRRIAWFCGVLFFSQVLLMTGIVIHGCYILIVPKPVVGTLVHGLTFCVIRNPSTYSWAYWTLVASFEAFVLVLTLRRGYQYCYQRGSPMLTNISPTLLRDSVTYTLIIGLVYLLNIVLSFTSDSNLDIGGVVGFTLPGLMNGRMMLNVRRVFETHRQIPSSPSQISFSNTLQVEDTEENVEPIALSLRYLWL